MYSVIDSKNPGGAVWYVSDVESDAEYEASLMTAKTKRHFEVIQTGVTR